MALIILARHGETDVIGKRLTGRITGIHLNQHGREQAQLIADRLDKQKIGAIFSSPLERTMETARPLSEKCGIPISPHSGLIETNYGAWQGRTYKQLKKLKMWEKIHQTPSQVTFPAGESFVSSQQRVVASLEEIASVMDDDGVAVCYSHCDPIRMAVAYFLNMALDDFQRLSIDPGSLTFLHLKNGKPHLGMINYQLQVENLPETPTGADGTKAASK